MRAMSAYDDKLEQSVALFDQHQYLDALQCIEEAVEMPDVDWVGLMALIDFSISCGEPEPALRILSRFASENRDTKSLIRKDVVKSFMDLWYLCSHVRMLLNTIDTRDTKRAYPEWRYPFCYEAHVFFELKRYHDAIKSARIYLARDGKCAFCESIVSLASTKLDIDGPELVRPDADFESLSPDELYLAAFNADIEDEPTISTLAYRKLITKATHPDLVKYGLARSLMKEEKWGEAIRAFEHVLSVFPRHLFAQHGVAYCLMKAGSRKEALAVADDMYRRAPWYMGVSGIYGASGIHRFKPSMIVKVVRGLGPVVQQPAEARRILRWMLPATDSPATTEPVSPSE